MRSSTPGFPLRSHVNGIVGTCADHPTTPQVPRIHVSTCPTRPTTHAQTLKRSPRPLASPEVNKNTLYRGQHHLIQKTNLENALSYIRDVCDARMTSRPLFYMKYTLRRKGVCFLAEGVMSNGLGHGM